MATNARHAPTAASPFSPPQATRNLRQDCNKTATRSKEQERVHEKHPTIGIPSSLGLVPQVYVIYNTASRHKAKKISRQTRCTPEEALLVTSTAMRVPS
jgi:hypothetical protein